jgi:methyltransferase (TIGR00027 family)
MPLVKGICTLFKAKNYQGFIATRKAYISQTVDNSISEGTQQVLVIGGGFDVMATVKHKQYTDVQFYELDRGPHQKMKQEALRDLREGNFAHHDVKVLASGLQNYAEINSNLHFIEADLGQPGWQEVLISHGFNPEMKTICIGEGLTMYLTQEEVTTLLSSLRKMLHEDSSLILSFMDPSRNTNTDKFADRIRGATNEKYKANIIAADVPEFMFKNGFSVVESLPREEIQKSLGLPESKMHLSAGLSENYFLAKPSKPGAILQPISTYKL